MTKESINPQGLKKPTTLRPSNFLQTERKQTQSRNIETIHRLAVLTKRLGHTAMQQITKTQIQHLQNIYISRTVLTRTIMTTPIMALISAWAGVLPNRVDCSWLHTGGLLRPLQPDLTLSCPHLGKRQVFQRPLQLPGVFTAVPHQTFIKCHLYSVWCEAISISQAVKWCLNHLLPGSVKKKHSQKVYRFLFSLTLDRWSTRYAKILILTKYLKQSNDSKSQDQLLSVNDPVFLSHFSLHQNLNCSSSEANCSSSEAD